MKALVSQQHSFYNTQITKDTAFRIKQLNLLERLLKEHSDTLDAAIYSDFKKSSFENFITEIGLLLIDISEAKKNLQNWARRKVIKTNFANFPARSYRIPEPLGVCLVIGAWNYPYYLTFGPAIAAIAAGNTVIIKPSEKAPQSAKAIAKLVHDHFDPSFFGVVLGSVDETTELLAQPFNHIFFTGSTKVGKIIYQAAAEQLTPATLEMGGKSPAFITKSANLKITAKRLIWSKFINAGQTCIAPDYVMIDAEVEKEFLKLAIAEIETAKYAFENDNYVQIISDEHFDRLTNLLTSGSIFYGGSSEKDSRYIEPTLLTDVSFDSEVMQEEIFGPILPVIPYTNLDEAITKVQALSKPLACYVFSGSKKDKHRVLNNISFGGGCINESVMHISNPNLPFGGVGNSGIGSYHGEKGFETFSHYKSILDKPTWLELPLKYSPYTKLKSRILRKLIGL